MTGFATRALPILAIVGGVGGMDFACSAREEASALQIVAPKDLSCLGVVGFEIDVQAKEPHHFVQMRAAPVLEPTQCRLDPIVVSELAVEVPLTVTIAGYDSQRRPIVRAAGEIGAVRSPTAHTLALAAVGDLGAVLTVDRSDLLGGLASREELTSMVLESGPPKPAPLLTVTITEAMRAYFAACEPGAFVLDSAVQVEEGDRISATFATALGPISPPQTKLQLVGEAGTKVWHVERAR